MDPPPLTRRPSRSGSVLRRLLGSAGLLLVSISTLIELGDAEPRGQMWVGAAAGVAFLAAVPLVQGDEARVLTLRARLLVGAGVAAVLAVIGLWQADERNDPGVFLLLVPAVLLFVTAVIAVREADRTGRVMRTGYLRSRLAGEEGERRRWAQELHDQTLQDLAAIEVRLGSLAHSRDPDALATGVRDVRAMTREQIRSLRHLITQMRPLTLDSLGLAAALDDLAGRSEEVGDVPVHREIAPLPAGLDPQVQLAVFRIVQEALTNALRHSACHAIIVRAGVEQDTLAVTVQDDGIGIEPTTAGGRPGFGVIGMQERAAVIGAQLSWSSPDGGGTLVRLSVPLPAPGTRPAAANP